MTDLHIDLAVIGVFSLVSLPYTLKFVWSPLMDRYVPPFLGRRRGWLIISQIALAAAILGMAASNPREHLGVTAALAVLTAFFSASQDIANDAYRADVLHEDELGLGSSLYVTGYRAAMIVSSAVALILADHLPWGMVYAIMAAGLGVGVVATVFAPEPETAVKPPKTLGEAVVLPFVEFFKRRGAVEIILFALLYKLDATLTVALQTPFSMGLGFSKTDIGAITKGVGLAASIAGTLVGGAVMLRLSLKRSLWAFGLIQAFAGLSFLGLALAGHSYPWLVTAMSVENLCSGMGNAVYAAFMLDQCDKRFSATQYALLTSLMAVTRSVLTAPSGYMASHLGWPAYYVVCIFASLPAFALLLRYDRWQRAERMC
jgi:PAT family beta-lactamase induction signal transducer AmpG